MVIEQKKYVNYSKKLNIIRTLEEFMSSNVNSPIMYDNFEDCKAACDKRNEWQIGSDWVPMEITLKYEVPE